MPPLEYLEWEEAGKWSSAAQAFLMLAFFPAVLIWGADFRFPSKPPPQAPLVISFIPAPAAIAEPAPTLQPQPEPPPEPEPEPEKVAAKEADIALKKKREKEKKEQEEKEKREKEKREKEKKEKERKKREKEKKEKKEKERKEREKKKKEKEKKEKERKKREEEERQRIAAESARALADSARRDVLNNLKAGYVDRIRAKIQPLLITPSSAKGIDNLVVEVRVHLDINGYVQGTPEIVSPSGSDEYDEVAWRAVIKASPLPVPTKEPALWEEFRVLNLFIEPGR
ncbi:MAG: TonB C-terminal domain-containing protein [Gammaproteobacteria bacterium]